MYAQITTRCNMTCGHCCFNCTRKGDDMSLEVFEACLDYSEYLSIGGGEPTIHPKFWEFLGLAIGHCEHVWLATNGSKTKIALALAKMAKKGVIGCALSLDMWHDPIDSSVIDAFFGCEDRSYTHSGNNSGHDDCREIRRSDEWDEENMSPYRGDADEGGNPDHCGCPGLFVRPNGDMYPCGCLDAPKMGNILDPNLSLPIELEEDCWKCQDIFATA